MQCCVKLKGNTRKHNTFKYVHGEKRREERRKRRKKRRGEERSCCQDVFPSLSVLHLWPLPLMEPTDQHCNTLISREEPGINTTINLHRSLRLGRHRLHVTGLWWLISVTTIKQSYKGKGFNTRKGGIMHKAVWFERRKWNFIWASDILLLHVCTLKRKWKLRWRFGIERQQIE